MKFRVIRGKHYDGGVMNGVCYKAGDVIETMRPLTDLYKNKFDLMPDDTPATGGVAAGKASKPKQGIPKKDKAEPESDKVAEPEVENDEVSQYKMKHAGRGRWQVVDGNGDSMHEEKSLTKKEAGNFLAELESDNDGEG